MHESPHGSRRVAILLALTLVALAAPMAPPATAQRSCTYFEFIKSTNTNSTLRWWYYDPETGQCTRSVSWRAGSGENQNPCDKSIPSDPDGGWLPNGWYDVLGHWNTYAGTAIWGRVWRLADKYCSDGQTLRTELFIHTEETSSGTQDCQPYSENDRPQCWDDYPNNNGTNDYYSVGCIKVRRQSPEDGWPNDLGSVHTTWHDLGGGSQHGSFTRTDSVYVHA